MAGQDATSALALGRARLRDRLAGDPGLDDVLTRYDRWAPDLWDGLDAVFDAAAVLPAVVDVIASVHTARSDALRQRDRDRVLRPDWFQSADAIGYVAYADLFAGDLQGIAEAHRLPDRPGRHLPAPHAAADPAPGSQRRRLRGHGLPIRALGPRHDGRPGRTSPATCTAPASRSPSTWSSTMSPASTSGPRRRRPATPATATTSSSTPTARSRTSTRRPSRRSSRPSRPATSRGTTALDGWVWTTFNEWQWDLNWANPDVFVEFADIIGFLANQGADCVRLDAIAFTWKRMGTNCQNQPEVHALTQALRAAARIMAPAADLQGRGHRRTAGRRRLPRPGRPRRQGERPRVPQLADGPDLVGARRPRRAAARHRALPLRPDPRHQRVGHLPALPRRHRLGDRRRRRRRRGLERLRPPVLPRRLLRRRLPRQLRHRHALPVQPRDRRPAHVRQRSEPRRAGVRPRPRRAPRRRPRDRSADLRLRDGVRLRRPAAALHGRRARACSTTTPTSTTLPRARTTAGSTARRWTGRWPRAMRPTRESPAACSRRSPTSSAPAGSCRHCTPPSGPRRSRPRTRPSSCSGGGTRPAPSCRSTTSRSRIRRCPRRPCAPLEGEHVREHLTGSPRADDVPARPSAVRRLVAHLDRVISL